MNFFPIIPALQFNPARPFLTIDQVIEIFGLQDSMIRIHNLSQVVYEVYEDRSDAHRAVRELLPPSTRVIGFAGTSAESEYSSWLPFGRRKVTDFTPLSTGGLPETTGFDAIVTSGWGCNVRFKMTPEQLASDLGWKIIGSSHVQPYASSSEVRWCVLLPKQPATTE